MKQRAGARALASREPMKLDAYERALLIYLPALVLLAAFVAVCVQAGTPWLWTRVVHEYGQHTLPGTIFPHFFEHSLGYAFTSALAGFLYLLPTRKS